MISENRDILVERLEHKLSEKEREIEEMRNSLKESIVSELREGMKDDLDFDKRISALEKKTRDMGLAYDGIMKELLDQKTVIRDLKEQYLKEDVKPQIPVSQQEAPEQPPKSGYIIAESEEKDVPPRKKNEDNIIIAQRAGSKSTKKGDIVVEARDDEDVVIEYKK